MCVLGIVGTPYCGIGATIRIGQEMLCLPCAGFFLYLFIIYVLNTPILDNKFSCPFSCFSSFPPVSLLCQAGVSSVSCLLEPGGSYSQTLTWISPDTPWKPPEPPCPSPTPTPTSTLTRSARPPDWRSTRSNVLRWIVWRYTLLFKLTFSYCTTQHYIILHYVIQVFESFCVLEAFECL